MWAIPKRNELVWVEFEKGDPRRPIWSYGYYGNEEKPIEFSSNKIFGFKTPGGFLILIDDENQTLSIKSPNGQSFYVDRDFVKIGKEDNEYEKIANGETLKSKLDTLFDKLIGATIIVPDPAGPWTATFSPTTISDLGTLKLELTQIISNTVKLSK
jgi:hypothetical protein